MAQFRRYWIFQQDEAPIPWAGPGLRTVEAKLGTKWVMLRARYGAKKRIPRAKWDRMAKVADGPDQTMGDILADLRQQLGGF